MTRLERKLQVELEQDVRWSCDGVVVSNTPQAIKELPWQYLQDDMRRANDCSRRSHGVV